MGPIIEGNSIYIGDCVIWKGVLDWDRRSIQSALDRFDSPHRSTLLSFHAQQNRWQCNYCGCLNLYNQQCKACQLKKDENITTVKLTTINKFL